MSTTVDTKVVSMQFDNKHFEQNVATTMSTLDGLKQKLNFSGASKGLDEISHAAKNVDMSSMEKSADSVSLRFSAMQVAAVTAIQDITRTAINYGKRIVSALTVDPIKAGYSEYELKMNSVQTIMASTGESIEAVNGYLQELNEYSDQTIYSFSDMTSNIGKFTNAGVKLEDAVAAIKGISNEAALAGANSNEASRAMYNFSQALSAGYVKLIDWKSIENANMATVGFKEELIKTAVELGVVTEAADGMYNTLEGNAFNATKNFNEVLQDQWMTSEVLITTLKKYADTNTEIGAAATAAATEVKTFSQLFETLKESAQSGWATTWELLIGDLEEAKELLTGISTTVGGFIDAMSDARNDVLALALDNPISEGMRDVLEGIADPLRDVLELTDGVTEAMKATEEMARRVIRGDFGNGEERLAIFTEQGWDYVAVQNKVNELLGSTVRHLKADTEARGHSLNTMAKMNDQLLRNQGYSERQIETLRSVQKYAEKMGISVEEAAEALSKEFGVEESLQVSRGETIHDLMRMSEEQLRAIGYSEDMIESLKTLAKYSEMTGISVEELAEDMSLLDGRTLLINSLKNLWGGLATVLNAVKDAWNEIFNPNNDATERYAMGLYKAIASLHKFTLGFKEMFAESGDSIMRTFKGIFALVDIIFTLTSGPLKIAFNILTEILGMFNLSIFDLTAYIGDALVVLRDWIDENNLATKILEYLAPVIKDVVHSVAEFIRGINGTRVLADLIANVRAVGDAFTDWFDGLKEAENIPQYIIQGLVGGLKSGITAVRNIVTSLGETIIEVFKSCLGIHSPSLVMFAIGGFIIAGLILGIKGELGHAYSTIKNAISGFIDLFQSNKLAGAASAAFSSTANTVKTSFFDTIKKVGSGILSFIGSVGRKFVDFIKTIDLGGLVTKFLDFVKNIDLGSVIVVSAIGATIVALLKFSKAFGTVSEGVSELLKGVGKLCVGIGEMASGIGSAARKIGKGVKNYLDSKAVLNLSIAIAVLAASLIALSFVEWDKMKHAIAAIAALAGVMVLLIAAVSIATTKMTVKDAKKLRSCVLMLVGISVAMLIFANAAKQLGSMDWGDLGKAGLAFAGFLAFTIILIKVCKTVIKSKAAVAKASSLLIKLMIAMGLMVIVTKMAGEMDQSTLERGLGAVAMLSGLIIALMAATKLVKDQGEFDKTHKIITRIATAMLLMVLVAKIAGNMSDQELTKGILAIVAFGGIIVGLMAATKLVKDQGQYDKTDAIIARTAVAMLLMAVATKIAGSMSTKDLIKGVAAVAAFGGIIVGLMAATNLVKDSGGKNFETAHKLIGKVAVAMLLMVIAAKIAGSMSTGDLIKGIAAVAAFGGIIVGLMAATKLSKNGKRLDNVHKIISQVGIAILLMAVATKIVGSMSVGDLVKGVVAIAAFGGIIVGLMAATQLAGTPEQRKNLVSTILGIAVAIGILAMVVALIGLCSVEVLARGLTVVTVLGALVAALIVASGKANRKNVMTNMITIGVIIGLLVGLVILLEKVTDAKKVLTIAAALTLLLGALGIMMVAASKFGSKSRVQKALESVKALTAMMIPLLLLTGILLLAQFANPAITTVISLVALLAACVYLLKPLTSLSKTNLEKVKPAIIALTAMMIPLLAFTAILFAAQYVNASIKTVLELIALTAAMTLLLKPLTSLGKTNLGKVKPAITALTAMAIPLLAFTVVLGAAQFVNASIKTVLELIALTAAMTLLLKPLTSLSKANLDKVKPAIIALTAMAIPLLAFTVVLAAAQNVDTSLKTVLELVAITAAMTLLLKPLSTVGKNVKNAIFGALALATMIVPLIAFVLVLAVAQNVTASLGTVMALIAIASACTLLLLPLMIVGLGFELALLGVVALTAMVVPLLAFIFALKQAGDLKVTMSTITVLVAIATACSLLLLPLMLVGLGVGLAVSGALALTAMVVPLLAFIFALKQASDISVTLGTVTALIAIATACTLLLIPLMLIGLGVGLAIAGALALTAMAVPLLAFVAVLRKMQDIEDVTTNVFALIALTTALTLLMIPLIAVGLLVGLAITGVLALTTMAIPLLAFVGILALMQNIENAEQNTNLLIKLLTVLTTVLVTLAHVGPMALVGEVALAGLIGLIGAFGVLATAVGALMEIPGLKKFMDSGLKVLEDLAHGIGLIVGKLIGGIGEGVSASLPIIGENLSAFVTSIQGFVDMVTSVGEDAVTGTKRLAECIILLTAASIIEKLSSFGPGSGFSSMGAELSLFAVGALPFFKMIEMVTPEKLEAIKTLAEAIMILTAADLVDQINIFNGSSSLAKFAGELVILGMGINSMCAQLGENFDGAKVEAAANAIKTIAEAAETIPNSGGLAGLIMGENDLTSFSLSFGALGAGLGRLCSNLGENFSKDKVGAAAEAVTLLAQAASEIPNSGGLVGLIMGEGDLTTFSASFAVLGWGLNSLCTNLGENFSTEKVGMAAEAIKTLAAASNEIPNCGGALAALVGDNDLTKFAVGLPIVGWGLAGLIDKLPDDFGEKGVDVVESVATCIKALADVSETISGNNDFWENLFGDKDLKKFSEQLPAVGTAVNGFVTNLGGITTTQVNTAVSCVNALQSLASINVSTFTDLANELPSAGTKVVRAMKTLAEDAVGEFINAIMAAYDSIEDRGRSAMEHFLEGAKSVDFATPLGDILTSAANYMKYYEAMTGVFKSAGKYCVQGFANGMSENESIATAAAEAVAKAAAAAASAALQINSPSKVFMGIGHSVDEGFAMGITKYAGEVTSSVTRVGKGAATAMSATLANVVDAINTDIDTQPTIRPVLDLTNVETQAGRIGSLLGGRTLSVGARSAGTISSMMNLRSQNGGNDDVISALDKLGERLDNARGDTYQINGVTYDDGSNIAAFAEAVIRQARVGRRV